MIKKSYVKSRDLYKVTFEVPTEKIGKGREVRVLSTFNDWNWENGLVLKPGKASYKATAELSSGDYQFRYLIDGQEWENDEAAEHYTASGFGTENSCFTLEAVAKPTKKAAPKTKKAAPKAKKATPAKTGTDDLKKIEGIGPKIAGLLNEAGITTFAELAKASKKKLADVLQAAGARFRLAKPDTWQEQAKLAAAGKFDELKALQAELKGGLR